MTDKDRLEEIKYILESLGEVFFGNISSEGIVSQDVADAEPYFLWMVKRIDDLEEQNKRYKKVFKEIRVLWQESTDATDDTHLAHTMAIRAAKALEGEE